MVNNNDMWLTVYGEILRLRFVLYTLESTLRELFHHFSADRKRKGDR